MEQRIAYVRALARLIELLAQPRTSTDAVKETLRTLVALARDAALDVAVDGWKLAADGDVLPAAIGGPESLATQMNAHGVQRVRVRQSASAGELLQLARALAQPASTDDPGAVVRQVAALKLWSVQLAAVQSDGADAESGGGERSEASMVVAHHLARARSATSALDAAHALGALVAQVDELVAAGEAQLLADVLVGIGRCELESTSADIRDACEKALDRLARPDVMRLVAQLVPGAPADAGYLSVLRRAGDIGAAALLAHLMAADTLEERRVFFDAIVAMRAGIPMLIDALGHPQWFVVRNAAALLGEMEAAEADRALARLLEHGDERVRHAAAGALSRITTPVAAAALQRMILDPSPRVRLHAASAYAIATGQVKNAAPLAAALDVELDGDVQISILAALGRLGTPDAVQKLVKAVGPINGRLRAASYRVAAVEALATARGGAAVPILRELLGDTEPAVRDTAKRLIAAAAVG